MIRISYTSSEIIVGTYEGIDFIMRSGKAQTLGNIGTVVIDEVHTLEDEEGGHRLDGLIARLKFIAPFAQYVYSGLRPFEWTVS